MPLPGSVSTATVTETYVDATGAAQSGTVTLTPNTVVTVAGTSITLGRVVGKVVNGVLLGPDGVGALVVAATDDVDLAPAGWGYVVEERVGRTDRSFTALLPAGNHVLHTLAPVELPPEGEILVRTVNDIAPDETGNIDLELSGGGPHDHEPDDIIGLSKASVGLSNVDNTSDANKPISTATQTALNAKARQLVVRQATIVSGDVAPLPNTAALWQPLAGFVLAIPAAVGDYVELNVPAMRRDNSAGNSWLDQGVLVGSTIVRFLSTLGVLPGFEGDPSWILPTANIVGHSGPRGFTVAAEDLDGGNVRFCIAVKSNGTGTLYASANYPFHWRAINYGPVA